MVKGVGYRLLISFDNGDGLSFTHTELTSGDIVYFEYYYQGTNVDGITRITYYNDRYVVIDSVTSTVYKWSITSACGTPSITLTEV